MGRINRYEDNVVLVASDAARLSSSLQALGLAQATAEVTLNLPDTLANRLESRASAVKLNQTIVNVLDGLPYGIGFAVRQLDRVSDNLSNALEAQVSILRGLGNSWSPVKENVEVAGTVIGAANIAMQPVVVAMGNRVTELELLRGTLGSERLPLVSDIPRRMSEFDLSAEAWQDIRQTTLDLLPTIDALTAGLQNAAVELTGRLPSLQALNAQLEPALAVFISAANTLRDIYNSLNININLGFFTLNLIEAIDTIATYAGFIQNAIEGVVIGILDELGFNTNIFGGVQAAVLNALNPLFAQFAGIDAATSAILAGLRDLLDSVSGQIEAAFLSIADIIGIDTLFPNEITAPDGGGLVTGRTDLADAIFGSEGNDTLRGGEGLGDNFLFGGAGDDSLEGGAGNDELFGNAGNDTLNGGAGDNLLVGGPGIDTAVYDGWDLDDILLTESGQTLRISRPDGVDRVQGVEFFVFADGTRSLTELLAEAPRRLIGTEGSELLIGGPRDDLIRGREGDDTIIGGGGNDTLDGGPGDDFLIGDVIEARYFPEVSAQVYRLYQAVLDRAPDVTGHLNWTTRIAVEGMDALQVTRGFVNSPEFQARFSGLDSEDLVTLLYQNVLDRDPDATGLARWINDLESGVEPAMVVQGFANSPEFRATTAADAAAFARDSAPSSWVDDVFRLYQAALDRAPDATGYLNWSGRLASGMEFLDVVDGFLRSPEFQMRFGDQEGAEFVTLLYQNVLGRDPDAQGLARWTGDLEGDASRAEVVRGFAQSPEFRAATVEDHVAWVRAQGTDDVLIGGPGDDVLAGGRLSDMFVFAPAGGSDRVLDPAPWDKIDLTGFGYASDAEALARMTQTGADVIFADQGTTVTFHGIGLEQISDEMIMV